VTPNKSLQTKEAWVIFFILGVVMLNFPFLHIFNKDVLVFGIPLIIVYIFIGWPISILVIYLFSVSLDSGTNNHHDNSQKPSGKGSL